MVRVLFFYTMVASFFGLGVCDFLAHRWRLGAASVLLGVVQVLMFWRKTQ